MTTPLRGLLEYAFLGRSAGLGALRALVERKVREVGAEEPEDVAQSVLLKLCGGPGVARVRIEKLAEKSPALAEAIQRAAPGTVPELTGADLAQVEDRFAGYVYTAAERTAASHHHKRRKTDALPDEDRLPAKEGADAADGSSDFVTIRSRVLAAVEQDAERPVWLDGAVEALEALAVEDKQMDDLTAECVAADETLRGLPPEVARTRARNRLQQQHKRAREHLLVVVSGLVQAGRLQEEEGQMAKRWVDLLMRRQKTRSGASRRS